MIRVETMLLASMYHAMPCSVLKRTFSLVLILWRKLDICTGGGLVAHTGLHGCSVTCVPQ